MNLKDIMIDDELKNLLPPLSDDEMHGLEEDIKKHGVLDPIILWNGFIADGHNRYSICKKLEITSVDTKELHKDSKAEVMEWIIDHQFARRNLNKSETIRSLESVRKKYEEEARERQKEYHGNQYESGPVVNLPKVQNKGRTSEKMAEKIGVSEKTYRNMRTIVNEGTTEQIERMDKGGKGNSVSAIAREIKEEKTGMKKCSICGKLKPLSEFRKQSRICKTCSNNETTVRGANGRILHIDKRIRTVPEDEIIGDLYDTDKTIVFTEKDLQEELRINTDKFIWSLENTLMIHRELLHGEKMGVNVVLSHLLSIKEKIVSIENEVKNGRI